MSRVRQFHCAPPIILFLFCLSLALLIPLSSQADESAEPKTVGSVKTVSGTAVLQRGEEQLAASVGDHLYQGDLLVTEANSSLGVIFRDDTIMSLGSKSRVRIDDFVFNPRENDMNFLVNVGKGTAQFISGQMVKLSPESMAVETPLSTIGIRGTRFLVKVD